MENQDRSLWNREKIAEGVALVETALKSHRFGPCTLQAATAAILRRRNRPRLRTGRKSQRSMVNWREYKPSPVVELNRDVAIAMRTGP